jgi:hypothetical protein
MKFIDQFHLMVELLLEENLSEVHRSIGPDPNSNCSQAEIRIEEVFAVARALHPPVKTCGYRVDITARIRQVLTHHPPFYIGTIDPLANGKPLRVGVREEVFLSHSAAIVSGHRQKPFIEFERSEPAATSHPVHFIQALLLERFNIARPVA